METILKLFLEYVRREYGDVADIFSTGEYPVIEDVQIDDDLLDDDPYGFLRKRYEKRIQLYESEVHELNQKLPNVYAIIYGQLHQGILNKIKMTGMWGQIERTKDP
jgi:hypothetical protein